MGNVAPSSLVTFWYSLVWLRSNVIEVDRNMTVNITSKISILTLQ